MRTSRRRAQAKRQPLPAKLKRTSAVTADVLASAAEAATASTALPIPAPAAVVTTAPTGRQGGRTTRGGEKVGSAASAQRPATKASSGEAPRRAPPIKWEKTFDQPFDKRPAPDRGRDPAFGAQASAPAPCQASSPLAGGRGDG
jgi:hypothetical protein